MVMRDDFYPVAACSQLLNNKLQCLPSVRRAFPPVGVHSTAEQLLHTTTVWLWLKTVVLQAGYLGSQHARPATQSH
jgi:hypothetical protein